jgi:hypothetical protein
MKLISSVISIDDIDINTASFSDINQFYKIGKKIGEGIFIFILNYFKLIRNTKYL